MTVQNIVEEVRTVFPSLGETQLVKELDKAQKDFVAQTRCLIGLYQLSSPDSYTAWKLPSDIDLVFDIDVFDSNGKPLYMEDDNIVWKIMGDYLLFYDLDQQRITSLPSTYYDVYLWVYKKPSSISDINGTLSIQEEYHPYLVNYIFAKAYSLYPIEIGTTNGIIKARDWNAVRFHRNEYERGIREAKKKTNMHKTMRYELTAPDFAGQIYKKKQQKSDIYSDAVIIPDTSGKVGIKWEQLTQLTWDQM